MHSSITTPFLSTQKMEKLFNIESYENYKSVLEQIVSKLTYSQSSNDFKMKTDESNSLEQNDSLLLLAAEEELRNIIIHCNFDFKKVIETLSSKPWDSEKFQYFTTVLEKEKKNLLYGSVIHHNSRFGDVLINSDWSLKLVLGTSELNTLRYPLLQLVLQTVNVSGVRSEKMFELDRSMVQKMIEELQKIENLD